MKKSLVALAFFSASVFAGSEVPPNQPMQNTPVVQFGVVDISSQIAKIAKNVGLAYSLKNQNHRLCWTAYNVPFQMQNKVIEVFVTPKASQFNSEGATVESSKDKKTHKITTMVPNNSDSFGRCWRFDDKDPLGTYKVDIQVNDIIFQTQTFELVK
ncbi:hypothetical protein E4T80_02015 [Muribacter muris]|uniref:Pseudouridine synthase n=1 Tax=Muribacter muris TaxID=67855 RepID=A0A4Y9K4K6_9PAST|nr:hypothetical protein [Muribacter muris]MBF0784253.1 hypothetical protein [Muribacter muris]MBF0827009.1 hypothetical protein [Muribacter muris]TFV12994.1 hypothetical protein E4T80_02015 [Muribacter muris]